MNKSQAIHNFWSGFGLPAYDQYTVPIDVKMPYITYSVSESEFEYPVALTGSLWYRSQSWEDITLKSYEISKSISLGGKLIRLDDGKLWIYRGSPFVQRMSDTDDSVRRIVINIVAEFFTTY
jgi:hypothetical protein